MKEIRKDQDLQRPFRCGVCRASKFSIMTKKAKGLLPKVEFMIILAFLLSFAIMVIPKCGCKKQPSVPAEEAAGDQELISAAADTNAIATLPKVDSSKLVTIPVSPTTVTSPAESFSRLFITIDGLNMRKEPGLKSEVIVKLPLYEEVYFLNEVTDSTTELSIGYQTVNEPWVKIRTKKGHEGWVYGAGVNYYKKKRPGTIE